MLALLLAAPCYGQVCRCPSSRRSDFALLEWLERDFRKVFFPKIPSAACHHSLRPESHSDAMARLGVTQLAQHVELTLSRVTRHAQRQRRQARLTRPGPSHSSGPPFITLHSPPRLPQPESLCSCPPSPAAAALPAATGRGPSR